MDPISKTALVSSKYFPFTMHSSDYVNIRIVTAKR